MPEGTSRYTTPASVRGPSLRDVHAQHKADQEFRELLKSDDPRAGLKAFASGLAAGAFFPLVTSAGPLAMQVLDSHAPVVAQAHLAHWLTTQNVSPERAAEVAPGLYTLLKGTTLDPHVESVARQALGTGWEIDHPKLRGNVFPTKEKAIGILHEELKKKGVPGWDPQTGVDSFVAAGKIRQVSGSPVGLGLSNIFPTPEAGRRVMDVARESFEAAGKKAPSMSRTARGVILKSLIMSIPAIATMGVVGGVTNVLRTRKQREDLQKLRSRTGVSR